MDELTYSSPPHAFPTQYSAKYAENPFPHVDGVFKFDPPVWRRRPATSKPKYLPVNMDEFIITFSKFNLREGLTVLPSQRNTRDSTSECRQPWFAATVTVAPPAPHPALLRSIPVASNPSPRSMPQPATYPSSCPSTPKSKQHKSLSQKAFNTLTPPLFQDRSPRTPSLSSITSRSRSSSSSSLSSIDPITPPCSPIIQARSGTIVDEDSQAFSECLTTTRTQHQSGESISLGLNFSNDMIPKQMAPFSQYPTNPLLALSASTYLEANP